MTDFIPYGRQTIEDDDIRAVVEVLKSPFLTTGPKVGEFEQAFAKYVSSAHAVALSSGTAGLHAAMWAAGIGPGDEVLVPTLSFLATANAVLYVGAKPVFVDCVPDGFNMDPVDAAQKVTSRTKAIAPVHFAGQPADLSAIHDLAKKRHLTVIEDAAHALGAVYRGKKIGALSDLTVFSFHPVKHITTGEGGMVTTSDPRLALRLRRFRHHGINVDVNARDARRQWRYDMVDLGYNYRLTDIQCALGLSQLKKSERFGKQRDAIAAAYDEALAGSSDLVAPPHAEQGSRHSWHLYIIRLTSGMRGNLRDKLFAYMRSKGIGVQVHYLPIHLHPYYRRLGWKRGDCPRSEKVFRTMLSLPIFPNLEVDSLKRIITTLAHAMPALS